MTRKEYKALEKQLKIAGKHWREQGMPDQATQRRMEARIMAAIQIMPRPEVKPIGFIGHIGLLYRYFMPSQFAYVVAAFALIFSAGAAVAISRNALPGDSLYGAKIAFEKAQVRFVSNPAERAQVQMEFAGNRLKEVQAITRSGEKPNGRVDETLTRFAKDVQEATNTLKQAGDPVQVKAAAAELIKRAEQYKQELAQTKEIFEQKAGATATQEAPPAVGTQGAKESTPTPIESTIKAPESAEFTVSPGEKSAREVGLASIEQAEKALQEVQDALPPPQ